MILRTLVTFVATFALALAAGILAVALNDWFGSGDLGPFGIYCIPFALLAAPAVAFVFGATKHLPVWLASDHMTIKPLTSQILEPKFKPLVPEARLKPRWLLPWVGNCNPPS